MPFITVNEIHTRLALIFNFVGAQNENVTVWSRSSLFSMEPELTQFGWSRSRLWNLGLLEPPKKWRISTTEFVSNVKNIAFLFCST